MPTLEITEVSDDLLAQVDERMRQLKIGSRSEYVRNLILSDIQRARLAKPTTFRDILEPVHRQVAESGMTDDELDALFEEAIEKTRAERRQRETTR